MEPRGQPDPAEHAGGGGRPGGGLRGILVWSRMGVDVSRPAGLLAFRLEAIRGDPVAQRYDLPS
ncbi:hypothetical protein PUN4_140040 [Paraburkholderia unamae]|nr:hypothetical protein PUN4_140040 [Paraburkholderia unamae]